jgi:ferritin-like metal-binding protein YciE
MESGAVLKITPDMSEEEIIQACAEAVFENSPIPIQKQLEAAASEQGYNNALGLIKASMKEERDQHDTLEGWLATLPGRIS